MWYAAAAEWQQTSAILH